MDACHPPVCLHILYVKIPLGDIVSTGKSHPHSYKSVRVIYQSLDRIVFVIFEKADLDIWRDLSVI
jgi:hypothetical protein